MILERRGVKQGPIFGLWLEGRTQAHGARFLRELNSLRERLRIRRAFAIALDDTVIYGLTKSWARYGVERAHQDGAIDDATRDELRQYFGAARDLGVRGSVTTPLTDD